MSIQITSFQALPQAKRLMHVEKSGPAFLPLPIAEQLGASLVAQTTAAIGDVLSAIKRECLLDVIPAWQRLLKVQGLSLPIPPMDTVTIRHRWAYAELRDAVEAALSSQVGPWAWVRPDMMIRQMAREQADRSAVTRMGLTRDWAAAELSGDMATIETLRQSMVTVTNNIATLRAFAEGK